MDLELKNENTDIATTQKYFATNYGKHRYFWNIIFMHVCIEYVCFDMIYFMGIYF